MIAQPRILVTGASGQVGEKLLRELAGRATVIATDIAPTLPFAAPDVEYRAVDLTQAAAVQDLVRSVKPAVIVNPAAYTAVDKAESEAETARKVNVDAVRILGEEARRLGIGVVHYSTDYVFAGDGTKPWREEDPTGPLGVYGQTKLDGELALSATGATHVIFRTSWVFSDHGANFVKTMLRFGAERELMKVVADQIGAPTSAGMLARMTARVLDRTVFFGAPLGPSGIYHLACAGETSWHGFAAAIFAKAKALGFPLKVAAVEPIPTEAYPTPARRPKNSRLDCAKFTKTFGIAPESWEKALDDVLKALRAQAG